MIEALQRFHAGEDSALDDHRKIVESDMPRWFEVLHPAHREGAVAEDAAIKRLRGAMTR